MSSESWSTVEIGETPFFRSDKQRYCRIAQMNFSPERKFGPEVWMIEKRSCSESSLERNSIESSAGKGSGSGFIESLQSERNTRKASRCTTGIDDAGVPTSRRCADHRATATSSDSDLGARGGALAWVAQLVRARHTTLKRPGWGYAISESRGTWKTTLSICVSVALAVVWMTPLLLTR